MSSRITLSVSSRRSKLELVKLLFAHKYAGKGPDGHKKLDPSIYSYSDLRKAYLERLQTIHPDKLKHIQKNSNSDSSNEGRKKAAALAQFVELQDAWDKYEQVAKLMQRVGKPEEANFTMFGVGCSFADTPEERALRDAITDQACRGWFSAGVLGDSSSEAKPAHPESNSISLVDDELFTNDDMERPQICTSEPPLSRQSRRSLVQPGFGPRR